MNEYKFSMVPSNLVEAVFHLFEECLMLVVELGDGEITLESLKQQAINNEVAICVVSKGDQIVAVNIFEERTFHTGKKCLYVPVISGTGIDEWGEAFHELAVSLAKSIGAVELRGCAARGGWPRKLGHHGIKWREVYCTIAFDIEASE